MSRLYDIAPLAPLVEAGFVILTPNYRLARRIFEDASRRPACPECGNRRTVPSRDPAGPPLALCPRCRANPGARLSDEDFLRTLEVEASLLSAPIRTWSAQVLIDGGAPAREADTSSISGFYGIDSGRPYWSPGDDGTGLDGEWVARP